MLLEPLADGVLEPLAALPELPEGAALLEPLVEPLPLVAPPEAESFFAGSDDEEALEDDGLLGVAPEALEDEDGELGVVPEAALEEPESFLLMSTDAEPDVELEPDGAVAEPDGVVVEPAEEDDAAPGLLADARSPALSPHAVSKLAPKTIDTATAKVESLILMGLRGWGKDRGARIGPVALTS